MTTDKEDVAYPATKNKPGYCPWCDEQTTLTIKGRYADLQKYYCNQCNETFYS